MLPRVTGNWCVEKGYNYSSYNSAVPAERSGDANVVAVGGNCGGGGGRAPLLPGP